LRQVARAARAPEDDVVEHRVPVLALGDDLLRHRHDVPVAEREPDAVRGREDPYGEIVTR
jgi:hypothetical protein